MDREGIWNRIRLQLQLAEDIYQWDNDAVICLLCKRKRLTALQPRTFVRHNASQRHQTNLQNRGNENAVLWERIHDQLGLDPIIYSLQDDVIKCKCCCIQLKIITLYNARKHDLSLTHQQRLRLWRQSPEPSPEAQAACSSRQNPYWMELAQMHLAADIPLDKLGNSAYKNFMQKWTKHAVPDSSTLRKTYVPNLYEAKTQEIRDEIGQCPIHFSVDETTDASKQKIVHAIITPLMYDRPGIPRLIHMEKLESANAVTICNFVIASLRKLWPDRIRRDKVLIYATDAAAYMILSGQLLRDAHHFNKLVHVRCVCHGLHLVAEKVRDKYAVVNNIIACTKKLFSKAPTRIEIFHHIAPGISMPPAPILTRWCTWIAACAYYDQYFDVLREVMDEIEFGRDVLWITWLAQQFENPEIQAQFEEITERFMCLSETITRLETRDLSLADSLEALTNVVDSVMGGENIPESISAKLMDVLANNEGLQTMINVNDCVNRDVFDQLPPGWAVEDALATRYASLTSVEVERSFSKFKSLYRDNRRSFTFDNLRAHMIVNCFGS